MYLVANIVSRVETYEAFDGETDLHSPLQIIFSYEKKIEKHFHEERGYLQCYLQQTDTTPKWNEVELTIYKGLIECPSTQLPKFSLLFKIISSSIHFVKIKEKIKNGAKSTTNWYKFQEPKALLP